MVDSVVYVLRSNSVLSQVIAQQGLLGTTVDELRSNLSINQYQATQIIEMHFTWRTEEEAESIWQAIVTEANQIIPQALQLGQLAIINPPEAAILSVSSIRKKAIVVTNEAGEDEICIRPMMNIQLTVDHRIIDGLLASQFVEYVKELLEEPLKILI